ncbi:MAG: HEAT repeat domain-containing protein [Planctomycetaceae bacterium]|jgi:hypothetical protein|nr:HEAT repeat domain-containing protein [Planctomycetaceae bacterium]
MKRCLLCLAALVITFGTAFASETSDKFAQLVPDFAAQDLNQRKNAQQSWQAICQGIGNNAALRSEVNKLITAQLAKDNPVETTVWLLRQLGLTGDASVVPTAAKFLDNKEASIRDEAARALANIPGNEAAQALKKSGNADAKNALISKEYKASAPAAAVETALPQGIPYAAARTVAQWMAKYETLSNEQKAATLNALAVRSESTSTDLQNVPQRPRRIRVPERTANRQNSRIEGRTKQYVKYAIAGAESDDATLRRAALLSLVQLGGVNEVPLLLGQIFAGKDKDAATLALTRLTGDDVDAALIKQLKEEQDQGKFVAIANILNQRNNKTIRPVLLDRAKAAGTANRLQLLQLAEPLSSKADAVSFVDVWTLIKDKGEQGTSEQIIARLVGGDSASVAAKLPSVSGGANSDAALSLLGRISDPKTLDGIKKLPNALFALANWNNAQVADDLFKIAEDQKKPEGDRITALRAFVRVISLPNDQLGIKITSQEQAARLEKAFGLAKRDEDKLLIIQRAGQIRTVESLRFVLKSFDDAKLQETVCGAVLDLAHHLELKRSAKDEFVSALDKVLSVTKRNDFKERANRYKSQN